MTGESPAIRPARPADAGAVGALWETMAHEHHAYDDEVWAYAEDATAHWRDYFRRFVERPDTLALLAEAPAGDVVGFLLAEVRPEPRVFGKRDQGFIGDLAVHPDWRRRGVASALVERAFDELRRRGVHHVILHVALDNEPAVAFYERNGMRRVMYRMYRRL